MKYYTTKEYLRETIDQYGVAIIPSVLNEMECNQMIDGLWDYFEHITQNWEIPIHRNNQDSWKEILKLYPIHTMLFQYFHCGHSQVVWNIRENLKILEIFSYFWECNNEDLLVSFDGFAFGLPPEVIKKGWNQNRTWYHTDQSYTRNEFQSLQSWVTAFDVNEDDATLGFMEGSNRFHKEFADHFHIESKNDWYKLTKEEENFYLTKECQYKKIKCPKGSIVFWDSRTIHCAIDSIKDRSIKNFREIIYLCYQSRKLFDKKNLEKKKKTFLELRMTNHYPCKIKLFPKNPQTYGKKLPEFTMIEKPILTDIGYKLAGF
jgi:ectoine hydroxylase-related dioxygenase (phytanoyl-CoA dioxygenase family)